jgi:YD repeat-containing protein
VDLPALPGILGLELVRHYNSEMAKRDHDWHRKYPGWRNMLGAGWRLSYHTQVFVDESSQGKVLQIAQADGSSLSFQRKASVPIMKEATLSVEEFFATSPQHGHLERHARGKYISYLWRWSHERELAFNAEGRLTRITEPSGHYVDLSYDDGQLNAITDPLGRKLELHYSTVPGLPTRSEMLTAIDTPVGRFEYQYGLDANSPRLPRLVQVKLPTAYDPLKGVIDPCSKTTPYLKTPTTLRANERPIWA